MTENPGGAAATEIAVARPDAQLGRERREDRGRRAVADVHESVAVLALRRGSDPPAERLRHQLHAVADPEHRHAHIEERRIAFRRASLGDAFRSAGQDDADGLTCGDERGRRVERQDFAIHRQFAQAPGDELCVLRAEIEDDDGLVRHRTVGSEFTVLYRCRTASPCIVCRVTGARAPSIDALTHRPRLHTHSPAGIADRGVRGCRDDGSRDGARPAAAARARQLCAPVSTARSRERPRERRPGCGASAVARRAARRAGCGRGLHGVRAAAHGTPGRRRPCRRSYSLDR